jgi:hypothetical protein
LQALIAFAFNISLPRPNVTDGLTAGATGVIFQVIEVAFIVLVLTILADVVLDFLGRASTGAGGLILLIALSGMLLLLYLVYGMPTYTQLSLSHLFIRGLRDSTIFILGVALWTKRGYLWVLSSTDLRDGLAIGAYSYLVSVP